MIWLWVALVVAIALAALCWAVAQIDDGEL